jgi:Na+/H+-dicarboxylate symporter
MRRNIGIAAGLILGLAAGIAAAATRSHLLVAFVRAIEPAGTLFVNLVRMVVVPLVVTTLFTGVARLGDLRLLGRLGMVTLGFFWSTTLVAIVIGMGTMTLALPLMPLAAPGSAVEPAHERMPGVLDFVVSLVPTNVIDAAVRGALLPLIVFTLFFAVAAGRLGDERKLALIVLAEAVTDALVRMVQWILWTAPVGVFALAASVTAKSGWSMLQSLALFIATVVAALIVFFAVVYLPAVAFLGRVRPAAFVKACVGPAAIAMSTTSSAASLPALFEAADQLGISPPVASFVLSLGSAINRTGSALFQGATIVFLAALYGTPLSAPALAGAVVAVLLLSMTVAGVPSAGVMVIAPALGTLGIPVSGLAILLGVDRLPDMVRTATQVTGHLAAATVAERFAGGGGSTRSGRTPPAPGRVVPRPRLDARCSNETAAAGLRAGAVRRPV